MELEENLFFKVLKRLLELTLYLSKMEEQQEAGNYRDRRKEA